MKFYPANRRSDYLAVAVTLIATFLLSCINLYPARDPEPGTKERAIVLSVDNRDLTTLGLLTTGSQRLELRILSGKFAGKTFPAVNQLRANMELDKSFVVGNTVLAAVPHDAVPGETVLNAQDHYRIANTAILFGLFVLLLLCFGGLTGAKALVSFLFCCAVIWKLVVPLCLKGYHAVWIAVAAVSVLTVVILREGDRVALRRRPPSGLLAGLYEPFSFAGLLSAEEVRARLTAAGLGVLRVGELGEAKHIFTHKEWYMVGFEAILEEKSAQTGIESLDKSLFFAPRHEIDEGYAIPSAYAAYRPFM